jgi:hypothetical protein
LILHAAVARHLPLPEQDEVESCGGQAMLPATAERVAANTSDEINEWIRRETDARVSWLAGAGPTAVEARLAELDREWDVERFVETMAPSLSLAGLALGIVVNRKWLLLPVVVQGFFLQHALQGWCPPIPVLRRLGVRTSKEINDERMAVKALRGDFQAASSAVNGGRGVHDLMAAVRG